MEKQFKKTLTSIQPRSNRSHSDTVREFFNCVSYTMIMNSLFQLERRELFYSGKSIYGFNQFSIKSGFIEKSIILTDRHKFNIEEKFYNELLHKINYNKPEHIVIKEHEEISSPKLSIVLPTYNVEKYIEKYEKSTKKLMGRVKLL